MTNDEIEVPRKHYNEIQDELAQLRDEVERLTLRLTEEKESHGQNVEFYSDYVRKLEKEIAERVEAAERGRDEALAALQRRADELNVIQGSIAAYQAGTLERQVAMLRELAVEINNALDAFWNDPERPPLHQMRSKTPSRMCLIQEKFRDAIAETGDGNANLDR